MSNIEMSYFKLGKSHRRTQNIIKKYQKITRYLLLKR